MGRHILHLDCRHHISEILLEAEYLGHFEEKTDGPNVAFFKKFKNDWAKIDQSKFKNCLSDRYVKSFLVTDRLNLLNFIQSMCDIKQVRDDYKELLNLRKLVLGAKKDFTFLKPGASHRARWMSKAIYLLKMYLCRDQLSLSKKELRAMQNVVIFIILVYIPMWFEAPLAIAAPFNDLNLIKKLKLLQKKSNIGSFALYKFALQPENHLRYLSEELVCLSLFDDRVDVNVKKAMAMKLRNQTPYMERKLTPNVKVDSKFVKSSLAQFVTGRSYCFFEILGLEATFLKKRPNEWMNE